ncbi:MAG: nucleotidyl transferase AbiEii/AbiGii toxin family protein [Nanoarchaeota archaeon]|nr:nucleotidyl transferase AbiEii/AbiGii toxin family protein [Nanoarchaeota archaeon]
MHAEKDYLQNAILYALYSSAGKEMVFNGGTCLYKLYGLNRFSEDLDFSVSNPVDFKKLLEKIMHLIGQNGIHGRIKIFEENKNRVNATLEIKGPLYSGSLKSLCIIGMDVNVREPALLPPERLILHHPYRDISGFDIFAMGISEILLEKIEAVFNRNKARDVYDLWFLLKYKEVKADYNLLNKKLKRINAVFSKGKLVEKLQEKSSTWKSDVAPLLAGALPQFALVKEEILRLME